MPRYVLPVLIVAAVLLALGLTWWTLGRSAGAEVGISEQELGPFRRIEVAGAGEVTLRQGDQEHISVETPARGLDIEVYAQDDTLEIVVHDRRRWWTSLFGRGAGARTARITVTYRQLEAITLAGAVRLNGSGVTAPELRVSASGGSAVRLDDLKTRLLRVSGSGALKATLSGEATEQDVSISGAGEYAADRLVSERASVSVSGVGRVVVNVQKRLSASISGAGSIEYYGNPEVKERVSGVGRVRRREATSPGHALHLAGWPLASGWRMCAVL